MAAVTDLASAAAAVTAGYAKTQIDRGALPAVPNLNNGQPLRYATHFQKPVTGATISFAGFVASAYGESSVSAAAADTQALAVLNANRRARYGGSGGRASGDIDSPNAKGGTHVVDVT